MSSTGTLTLLAQYKHWADQLLFDNLAELPPEELARERAGPLPSLIGILNHVYVIDRIWQGHMLERDHGYKSRMEIVYPGLAELRGAQEEIDRWFVAWTREQTPESLDRPLAFRFLSGNSGVMSAGEMFLHVVNHATFHRGWVTQLLFEVPAHPPVTDLCVYLTEPRQAG